MKFRIFVIGISFFIVSVRGASSQNPTYILKVTNITRTAPNELTFEIRMQHTNSPVYFEYAGAQFFFDFNTAIANGGTLSYTFAPDTSDLPINMRPRNPQIFGSQLRLAVNTFPGAGNGYVGIQSNSPGTKIVKMAIRTSAIELAPVNLNLKWRNTIVSPRTKLFAYVAGVNTEITDTNFHYVDTMGFVYLLDIKLSFEGLLKNGVHVVEDSIDIEFRNITPPYQIVYSEKAFLNQFTLTSRVRGFTNSGTYYIVLKHRNSLETWSRPGGELLGNGNYFYDFTTSASQAYGNNMVLKDGLYCIYSGNVNSDDVIDAEDLLEVDNAVFNYESGTHIANLNGDNIVDIEDMAICDNNARSIRVVERPGSLDLFKIGTAKLNPFYQ